MRENANAVLHHNNRLATYPRNQIAVCIGAIAGADTIVII